jgi:death on curing protein
VETEAYQYIEYPEAVALHFELMRFHDEIRYGVFDRTLIESALARPQQALAYSEADAYEQAATLCYGLIKNHPWVGGDKRTATYLTESFLRRNGLTIRASLDAMLELMLAIESDQWDLTRIADWMRRHTIGFPTGEKK